MLINIYYIYLF